MTNEAIYEILAKQNTEEIQTLINDGLDLSTLNLVEVMAEIFGDEAKEFSQVYLRFLIENGIDIYASTDIGYTPLMIAIIAELDEIKYLLLEKGIDIHKITRRGMSATLWAVAYGDYNLAKALISRGGDIHQTIEIEVEESLDEIKDKVARLLGKIFDRETNEPIREQKRESKKKKITVNAFAIAFNKYNKNIIKLLLELGFDPNENILSEGRIWDLIGEPPNSYNLNNTAISRIIKNNDTEVFNLLIEKGVTNFKTKYLVWACEHLNSEMIKKLVEKGVEINVDTYSKESFSLKGNPLSIVCSKSTVEPCYQDCADNTDISGQTVYEIIKFLIDNGADVNIDSPLMAACSLKYFGSETGKENKFYADVNLDIIKLLVEKGADVNYYREHDGMSILMEAVNRMNGYEIAKILIENGADVHHKDKQGNSCLLLLIDDYDVSNELNIPKVMHLLIQNGADVNAKNNMGMTPLMHYAFKGDDILVKILLENGANINAKSEMTAFDLASDEEIKEMIQSKKNNYPQKLVKLLTNFTIDKPIKYTTHAWDFGELQKEYGNFEGYMSAIKKQFEGMKSELETLGPNLHKKVHTFLMETYPSDEYSWCSKAHINIGWSSLDGLQEWCDSGKNPFDFKLQKPLFIGRNQIVVFGEIINLFKQEIEVRADFKNLEQIFLSQDIRLDLSSAKLNTRQFYTDTEKLSNVLKKIFAEMKKREDFGDIEVSTTELDDRSIELKITQIGSTSSRSAEELLERAKEAGDLSEIKTNLTNLCDWSIESSFEDACFRVNFLHSNNVKDIESLKVRPKGFTHVLRFYK